MNKVKTNYMAENIDLLANLTWKELETIYYLRVPRLKDYAGNLSDITASLPAQQLSSTSENQPVITDSQTEITEKPPPPVVNQPMPQPAELKIAQTIQQHLRDHVSNSPFAKLKSSLPAGQEAVHPPLNYRRTIEEILPASPLGQEPFVEYAWFNEPVQKLRLTPHK